MRGSHTSRAERSGSSLISSFEHQRPTLQTYALKGDCFDFESCGDTLLDTTDLDSYGHIFQSLLSWGSVCMLRVNTAVRDRIDLG